MNITKHILFIALLLPIATMAQVQELAQLTNSLTQLANVLGAKMNGGNGRTIQWLPAGKPPTDQDGREDWLLEVIENYDKNPAEFAKNISGKDFRTVIDVLKAYFNQAVEAVEEDEGDIDIDSKIQAFVGTALKKKIIGGLALDRALDAAIRRDDYDNVKKYVRDYFPDIKKEDFAPQS